MKNISCLGNYKEPNQTHAQHLMFYERKNWGNNWGPNLKYTECRVRYFDYLILTEENIFNTGCD